MRSCGNAPTRSVWWGVAAVAAALLCVSPSSSAETEVPAPAATGSDITAREIDGALEKLKADPNLAAERKMRTLKWVKDDKQKKKRPKNSGWMDWLADLLGWFAQQGRFLFWGVLAVLASFILIYLWRLVRAHGMPERKGRFEAPSFVRDLDIRPESLPADIGDAARKHWDSGEQRAALALLYRGLLSRLVHVHHVPIRDSSTEGDCLALSAKHLATEDRKIFVTSLVRVWQRAVYGGESIPTESVHALCDEFGHALDAPAVDEHAPGQPGAGASA